MRLIIILLSVVLFCSCSSSSRLRLDIPDVFKEQATMVHIKGAHGNKMSMENFSVSKIKRGMHMTYPGWGRGFLLENLLLNQIGIHKNEKVVKEKAKFRYSLSDGKGTTEIFARETELTRSHEFRFGKGNGILNSFEQVQEYQYIFSAIINTDNNKDGKTWELMMSNIYDREKEKDNSLFKIVRPDDNGLATNGQDTIFIKGLAIKKTQTPSGKEANLLVKILSGYELSTPDGVIAIIDLVDKNIWFYNELDNQDKLTIASIATAIFARRVKDAAW